MLKFRYLLIWAVAAFIGIAIVSFVVEDYILQIEAMEVKTYTEIAADCALQTGQGIDDFFAEVDPQQADVVSGKTPSDLGINGRKAGNWLSEPNIHGLKIMYDKTGSASAYSSSDLLKWYIGVSHSTSSATYEYGGTSYSQQTLIDRRKAFVYLYDSTGISGTTPSATATEFGNFARSPVCCASTTQLPIYIDTQLKWVKVPRIALIGSGLIWADEAAYKSSLQQTNLKIASAIYKADDIQYGWQAILSNGYKNATKGGVFGKYFLSPSKVGVTYIPREMVECIYKNNLDLLLRLKFHENYTLDKHNGVEEGTWGDKDGFGIDFNKLNYEYSYNVINNGLISISKDTSTITNIDYATVDVFDNGNNDIIGAVYGGIYTGSNSTYLNRTQVGVATGSVLRRLSPASAIIPAGSSFIRDVPSNKREVIAKITFSTDVVLTHKTAVFTNWAEKFGEDGSHTNINDIQINNGVATNTSSRSKKYSYTRYFDVNA